MLAVIRVILIFFSFVYISIFGIIYCMFNPKNPNNNKLFGKLISIISYCLGIKFIIRYSNKINLSKSCVYVANHQSNYDVIIVSKIIQSNTLIVGKKSILWIPIFGIFYWLSGNILIDRKNTIKSYRMLNRVVQKMKKKNISLWIFPEGTRNYGKKLLPFKSGAFYTAINAKAPIIPVCISNFYKSIKLNKLKNGVIIIEFLNPINCTKDSINNLKNLKIYCRNLMKKKLLSLNQEANEYNKVE